MNTAEVSCRTSTGVICGYSKRSLYSSSGLPGSPNTYSTPSRASPSQTAAQGLRSGTAPLQRAGRERLGRGDHLVQLDVLVLAVREAEVTGAEDDRRNPLVLEERAVGGRTEVDRVLGARRRDALSRDLLAGPHHRLHDRMLPRRLHRRPVVQPLETRRMLAQPRVEAGGGEHVLLDLLRHL